MKLSLQKRLASEVLGVGKDKVYLDPGRMDEIKEAITRADIRALVAVGAIKKKRIVGTSRVRARKRQAQRRKGRQKGTAHRKGGEKARLSKKKRWMSKVRAQRKFLSKVKGKIPNVEYRKLYSMVKGGFFRSVSHIKIYMEKKVK